MPTIRRLIDLATLKPNPHAGRTTYQVAGRAYEVETPYGKERRREVQTIYSMTPEPAWLYSYEPLTVKCVGCGTEFPVEALGSDSNGLECDDCSDEICPKCGMWECLDSVRWEFETVAEAQQRQAAQSSAVLL